MYVSGLALTKFLKSSPLELEDRGYATFNLQSISQIIAEIDVEVNSESRLNQSNQEKECGDIRSQQLSDPRNRNHK